MRLSTHKSYFINKSDVVLRRNPEKGSDPVNHLILGDYVNYKGEIHGEWIKVRSRRNNGWIKNTDITDQRLLEVNFVDIGQGDGCHIVTPDDEIILIDAGEGVGFTGDGGDNMARFLNWRYNLRNRKVAGVNGVKKNAADTKDPLSIDYVVITHPDMDHYYGFDSIFQNKKLKMEKICHNGIVERSNGDDSSLPWMYDLGQKIEFNGKDYLWDTVNTNKEFHDLISKYKNTRKFYLKTLVQAWKNNKNITFKFLSFLDEYLDHFNGQNKMQLKVLAPVPKEITYQNRTKHCLVKLKNESKTKNGHSIVFQLHFGKLKMLLGGDLNSPSQDYLAQHYSGIDTKLSDLENSIEKLQERLESAKHNESVNREKRKKWRQDLEEYEKLRKLIITKTSRFFKTDISKACHHGASDVLDSFLYCINPIATIISSGDNESHSHPRPDALGAFGKSSRGKRPLIFSTELTRSSYEFSYPIKFYNVLKKIEEQIDQADTKREKQRLRDRMESMRESNVAKYGMITVRTDGEKVIIAQKLEKKRSDAQKWDIYELTWNQHLEEFQYRNGGSH